MPLEQYGRRTSVDAIGLAQDEGQDAALARACSLHALNEVSKNVMPLPTAARLIVARSHYLHATTARELHNALGTTLQEYDELCETAGMTGV
ncbi:hypothetical protein ACNPQM_33810 [Streptomyces sp. NPDC056231]|uniref:hypothetical protein n=1 Tax=Streptomyces sp. NPDC056231 TaxID=3345755 RepID=UPI003AACCF32